MCVLEWAITYILEVPWGEERVGYLQKAKGQVLAGSVVMLVVYIESVG
jgi:hypothetical protein